MCTNVREYLYLWICTCMCIYVFMCLCEMYSFGIFAVPSVMFRLNGVRISAKGTIQKHKN